MTTQRGRTATRTRQEGGQAVIAMCCRRHLLFAPQSRGPERSSLYQQGQEDEGLASSADGRGEGESVERRGGETNLVRRALGPELECTREMAGKGSGSGRTMSSGVDETDGRTRMAGGWAGAGRARGGQLVRSAKDPPSLSGRATALSWSNGP
jgi:hypothetical protein